MVEVALSPDLQRGFSEVERLRVGFGFMERSVFPPLGSLQASSSWSGGDESRHSQVSSGRRDSGGHSLLSRVLHSLFEMEARLKADVIVVKVSCLMPYARASGYASTGQPPLPCPACFFSVSLATASLEESSLMFFIVVSILWLMGTGPLVLKGQGCVDGFSGVIAFYEPASRHSSHPGTVVFYGGVADFLAGFGIAFQDVAVSLMAEASTYSFWDPVQASCGASFIPALLFARLWYVLELSPLDV
ncbi:hypothetical protein Bca52824_071745 [Brassica carinata]|uniref:Uncharacterized protein n=1 Tax=Brassica carinata TaxID=52824 RepID=A0A8X7U6A9_BRACI|nr:hypothetical protein Bca52824_071745 [Brassica carinata]